MAIRQPKEGEKRCRKCLRVKSIDNFYEDKSRKDGRNPYCNVCNRKRNKLFVANSTPEQRQKRNARVERWRKRNPKKRQSQIDLTNAVNYHGIVKKKPCVICGDTNSQAHHQDYSKPYDVIWLCALHHKQIGKL